MIDTVKARPSVSNIPTVSDFPNMFPEELLGLPPQREIEFAIDVVPGATQGIHYTVPNGSNGVKRIEASVARTARKRVYSTKCITMGSSHAFC